MRYILTVSFTTGLYVSETMFIIGLTILLTDFVKRARVGSVVRSYSNAG
jgi:hypothetical protein